MMRAIDGEFIVDGVLFRVRLFIVVDPDAIIDRVRELQSQMGPGNVGGIFDLKLLQPVTIDAGVIKR
jgi:hypothetical protein